MTELENPLVDDRLVDFLLRDVVDAPSLTELPAFAGHDEETFGLYLASARRLARKALYPAYKPMDEEAPTFDGTRVRAHPAMSELWPQIVDLGVIAATRPEEVGGQQLPHTVAAAASAYLMAANLSAYCYAGLTAGAAHLIEAFGDDVLRQGYMEKMYAGEWTGTMALTEPHAGSSLGDIETVATPTDEGHYRIRGSKIFISGGDHDLTENVVHLLLARIEGAPKGTKGISLFVVPRLRVEGDALVPNDVHVAGVIHKIGWKGLPSLALSFGDEEDCHGYLVGAPNQGLRFMFQMMNEARLMVGTNAVATASVAYHESRLYALERRQGRSKSAPAAEEMVPIVEHADVRRMLLRQKAIVEGSLCLVLIASKHADLAAHHPDEAVRERSQLLLDLLTPVAKSYPAEKGYESNALALQIHGGYGYSSEYLPEAWLRDQKLNSIHEGTTGIQSLDLLGRKAVAKGGAALRAFGEDVGRAVAEATRVGLEAEAERVASAMQEVASLTAELGERGLGGDIEGMLGHSADYLDLFGTLAVGYAWLRMGAAAKNALEAGEPSSSFYQGELAAARYFIRTEIPRVAYLADLCREGERSYIDLDPEWL